MYHIKVPSFVKTFYIPSFKLLPKHEYINMIRTMNSETHQYRCLTYIFNEMKGQLCGEFLINENNEPDGRCRFLSEDENYQALCYFKNGVLQKGPQFYSDYNNKIV